ncbi:Na+/H+ antiporter NhaC family protein [Sporosarcina sp. PTS2304]|uniref:Na+/H+ antiporter NhaC family protein n=1 Tax=Sporosarcina sp. PTS2304 TaxID=2283194 RepID=UPI000E0D777C|nr:Na+/H+ antiporter NhaC family protein [Sporosarcina sp. PTS2304]AXH99706.1 Na+/H+ antiporter NhaC family protein [Sporosarcina sp. PTS2304]
MIGTWVSILPPVIAIVMVLVTRRVLLSLGAGILTAALLIAEFAPIETLKGVFTALTISFWDDGLNTYNIFIMLFLLLLGVITAFVSLSGGSAAFARWAVTRIRTKRGAKLLTMILGIAIFVDDYFNALAVGQIARPITDQHKISRAKLAYFIDSTSAPICVVSPISSWGAFLIGQLALILGTTAAVSYSPLTAFIMMAPMNFYVIATLSMVFFFAWTNHDFFEMKKHEDRANQQGHLYDPQKEIPGELKEEFPEHTYGKVRDLVLPIVTLIFVTLGMMIYTGYVEAGIFDIWAIFENTDVPKSLVIGGITATLLAMFLYVLQMKENETANASWMARAFVSGLKAMMPAILILIFAWGLTELIATLDTGLFLSTMVEQLNIPVAFLPVLIFILAGLMAFSTGTSWGSFGILMPIAGTIMVNAAPELLLPALAAVLAGAVFGDHCSPISDTTILSSTGAGCNHMDHVATQLPYALVAASVAAIGYFVLGLTGSVWIGLVAVVIILIVLFTYWSAKGKRQQSQTV